MVLYYKKVMKGLGCMIMKGLGVKGSLAKAFNGTKEPVNLR